MRTHTIYAIRYRRCRQSRYEDTYCKGAGMRTHTIYAIRYGRCRQSRYEDTYYIGAGMRTHILYMLYCTGAAGGACRCAGHKHSYNA
jgi:hypothetical protein